MVIVYGPSRANQLVLEGRLYQQGQGGLNHGLHYGANTGGWNRCLGDGRRRRAKMREYALFVLLRTLWTSNPVRDAITILQLEHINNLGVQMKI